MQCTHMLLLLFISNGHVCVQLDDMVQTFKLRAELREYGTSTEVLSAADFASIDSASVDEVKLTMKTACTLK
jgi:hypothetical protein